MKFTKIPETTMQNIQLNAGVLLSEFNPATPTISLSNIIGATTGGVNFRATPTFTDFGEDIDNCPKNTKELKQLDNWEVVLSGTYVTITAALAKGLVALADVDSTDATHIVPRNDVSQDDFDEIWWVGDYSDKTGNTNGGFVAVKMSNALSTGGLQIQSTDKNKGQFAFEYTAHYSISEQEKVPFDVYVKAGTAEPSL